jgi:hypothetical protein
MKSKHEILFDKPQYTRLIIGILLVAIGFVLMSGGGSDDPKVFHEEVFNFQRIGLAPAVILIGFGVVIYSIFKK